MNRQFRLTVCTAAVLFYLGMAVGVLVGFHDAHTDTIRLAPPQSHQQQVKP